MKQLIIFIGALYITTQSTLQADTITVKPMVIKDLVVDMSVKFPVPGYSPVQPHQPDDKTCRRSHQGLYNEIVHCIDEQEDGYHIYYTNIIYGFDEKTEEPLSTFWVLKNNAVPLDDLAQSDAFAAIPNPKYAQEPTVVIIYPWNNLSIGTRLVHFPEYDTENHYAVLLGDYTHKTSKMHYIPHTHAMRETIQSPQKSRKLFVQLLNHLVHRQELENDDHVIPYVWGGSSFIRSHDAHDFYQHEGIWHREYSTQPYTGYDCSELIMRTAQMAGLNFPWKTTKAMITMCRPLQFEEEVQEGDIIWVPGHVLVISNLEKNEVIEARGYVSGYGCIHRLTLSECFSGITTINELIDAYHNQKPLTFLNKAGAIYITYNTFKILTLINANSI